MEKKIPSSLIPQPSMAEYNCLAGLKAGQGQCKETRFLQSLQKPIQHFCSHTVTLFALMNPLMYILTLSFILHCLFLFFLLDSSAERLTPKEFEFLEKQSICACSDHVLSLPPNFGLSFLFCASDRFPASWH